mmetsp:Transcript_14412/g.21148  ORF Transcript_14412/g.21148 Transcript_14412/m.21148 type:complete len:233 (-) Transcript_14412:153-851(-)
MVRKTGGLNRTETALSFLGLPDEVLLQVFSFASVSDLGQLDSVNSELMRGRLGDRVDEVAWKRHCETTWKHKSPRYHQKATAAFDDATRHTSWKQRYRSVLEESSHTTLDRSTLQNLDWYFNYAPEAGGRGRLTVVKCVFVGNVLLVPGYPPFNYQLTEDEFGRHALRVEVFPLHYITRLEDGEWAIHNDYVTFVSVFEDDLNNCTYRERGFLDDESGDRDESDAVSDDDSD